MVRLAASTNSFVIVVVTLFAAVIRKVRVVQTLTGPTALTSVCKTLRILCKIFHLDKAVSLGI